MSGHIFGGPTPTAGGDTHWYTTNSEYGKTVMQTKPTGGIPSYNRPSFYIAPRKLPGGDPIVNANTHAQNPIPALMNERRAEADARMVLTTGPAKQFMQHEMGRFWNNIQETTDSSGAARAAAMAPMPPIDNDPVGPLPPPVATGAAGQEQVSAGHSDILTITRNGDEGVAEFKTRPDVDALSHSVPSTASSTGRAMLAPPTGQLAPRTGQMAPPTGQLAPPTGQMAPPAGQMAPPIGRMAPSTGQMAPPTGQMAPPTGQMAPPTGQMAPPIGQMAPPTGQMAPPTGQMAPPAGQMAPPIGLMAPLTGQMAPPTGQMAPPTGQMAPPTGQLASPNGQVAHFVPPKT